MGKRGNEMGVSMIGNGSVDEGRGRKMILTKKQTKSLQGIAILFMLGLHLFNRIDIAGFYDVKIYWGGGYRY